MAAQSQSALRISYPALLYAGMSCVVLGSILRSQSGDEFSTFTLIYPGVAAIIAALACGGVLLYRSWRCIEFHAGRFDAKRKTLDPAAAVALTFVPVVNVVGVFFSLGRLPTDLNWLARAAGLKPRAPESLGYAAAAMVPCTLIPVIGQLVGIFNGLFLIPPLIISCSAFADSIENQLPSGQPNSAHQV